MTTQPVSTLPPPSRSLSSGVSAGWLLALATLAAALFFSVLVLAAAIPADQLVLVSNMVSPALTFMAAGVVFAASRHATLPRQVRLGWLLIALALLLNGLGSLVWLYFESVLQTYPAISLADLGWLGFYPLMLAGVLCFPSAPRSRAEQTTFWLDALTVVLGGGMLIAYFSLGPRIVAGAESLPVQLVTLAYPLADFVSIFALASITLRRPDPRSALALRVVGAGLLVNSAANLGYTTMLFAGTYQTGLWPSAGWVIAFALIGLGAQIHVRQSQASAGLAAPAHAEHHQLPVVPYVGISLGYLLLVWVAIQQWQTPLSPLILGASALTGVVLARQVVALRDNLRLESERQAAERASQIKSEFMANMSHELRTPLNSIINFSRILSAGARGPVTPEQLDYLNRVRGSGEHLLGLINDILDLSKIEAGKLELFKEPLDLAELARQALDTTAALVKEKPIQLRAEIPATLPPLTVDRTRMRQVLLNLLSNAAKFTEAGTITLRIEPRGAFVVIQVIDTGIGIAPEHQSMVFEEFQQIDSASNRRFNGTGLGLPICKRLVSLHGGRLWVESELGRGSTFAFSLPCGDPAEQSSAEHPAASAEPRTPVLAGPAVLVIDDDPAAVEIVRTYLGRDGFVVHGLDDSRRTLEAVRTVRPQAIILDVLMPHRDGWQVLAELKADPELRAIPVVLYTIVEQKQHGFMLGASAYLVKPIDEQQLRDTVQRLVETGGSILIVDDDPDTRELLSVQLRRIGVLRVETAQGGREGLALMARHTPDAVILDLMMPNVDGFAVLEEMQRAPMLRDVPVIILSAKELTRAEQDYLQQRVTVLMRKGDATPEQLRAHVHSLLLRQAAPAPRLPVVERQ